MPRCMRAAPDRATGSGSRRGSGTSPHVIATTKPVSTASTARRRFGSFTQIPVAGASKRDEHSRDRQRPAQPACGCGRAGQTRANLLGEVDGEDERDDDGVHARRAAIPQRPRHHPGPRGRMRIRPAAAHGCTQLVTRQSPTAAWPLRFTWACSVRRRLVSWLLVIQHILGTGEELRQRIGAAAKGGLSGRCGDGRRVIAIHRIHRDRSGQRIVVS